MRDKEILLVEDNPDDEALTLRALRKNNITSHVTVMRDGQEAVDYLLRQGAHAGREAKSDPELVLLDLKLPKLNGLEVLERLRADPRTRTLPVVVLTTSQEDDDVMRSYSAGANSYVRKPVDFNEFMEAVRQLGVFWLQLNVTPPRGGKT